MLMIPPPHVDATREEISGAFICFIILLMAYYHIYLYYCTWRVDSRVAAA